MRYDQYYLVHRLSENLSEEEEDFPHIGQIRFSNGSDKKCRIAGFKLNFRLSCDPSEIKF